MLDVVESAHSERARGPFDLGMEAPTLRKTLLSGLVAGLVLAMAPSAGAATRDLPDVEGDVMTATVTESGTTYHREGGAEGDINFARIGHSTKQVLVYLRFRQLTVPRQYGGFDYILEGNNGVEREITIETRHGLPQGTVTISTPQGKQVRCAHSHRINYAGDSVSLRLGRGCLKSPKYVRMRNVSYYARFSADSSRIYYDDPNRDGGTINQVQQTRTPWVVTG